MSHQSGGYNPESVDLSDARLDTLFKPTEMGEGSDSVIALVAGFDSRADSFTGMAAELNSAGHDVVVYEHAHDLLLAGDPRILPGVIGRMSVDFAERTQDHSLRRFGGVSIGSAIAWNMQKAEPDARPGIYAAAGADPAPAVMKGAFRIIARIFQKVDSRKAYEDNDFSMQDVRDTWEPLVHPPESGLVAALGGLDLIMKIHEVAPKFKSWGQDIPLRTIIKPLKGHTGIIEWYQNNPLVMLDVADSLELDN